MKNKKMYVSIIFFVLFVMLMLCVWLVDRQTIGPNGSVVGFATINGWFARLVGSNMVLYNITDWGGFVPVAVAIMYAIIGLMQWIKRKRLFVVDASILILGVFYILIFGIYMLFNYVVINYRPVLINGYLEASFPSSTTLMSMTFMLMSIYQSDRLIQNNKWRVGVKLMSICVMLFLVIGRLISGVHWLTDIVASVLLSIAIVYLYYFLCEKTEKGRPKYSQSKENDNFVDDNQTTI